MKEISCFAYLVVLFGRPVVAWHGYNFSYSRLEDRSDCPSFQEATKPYDDEFVNRLSLWPNLTSKFDQEYGETLYGSKEALEIIRRNQNPEDCSKAKYIVSGGWPYGFGSRIHMEGLTMGIALHLGRVYLPHPDGDNFYWETGNKFCRNDKRSEPGMNCFYAMYSKCTIKDATAQYNHNVNALRTYHMGDFVHAFEDESGLESTVQMLEEMQAINIVQISGGGPYHPKDFIPHQMRPIIDCSPIREGEDAEFYWWRAVSGTFIARPNQATLDQLAVFDTLPIEDYNEVVAMFVRHGDKGIEMKLIDFPLYRETAQLMWDRGLVPVAHEYLKLVGGYFAETEETAATATAADNTTVTHSVDNTTSSIRGSIADVNTSASSSSGSGSSGNSSSIASSGNSSSIGSSSSSSSSDNSDGTPTASPTSSGGFWKIPGRGGNRPVRRQQQQQQHKQLQEHLSNISTHNDTDVTKLTGTSSSNRSRHLRGDQQRQQQRQQQQHQNRGRYPGRRTQATTTDGAGTLSSSNNSDSSSGGGGNLYNAIEPSVTKSTVISRKVPFNGTLFITTEDPQVLRDANAWGAANGWSIMYTNLFDRSKMTAMKTWDEQQRHGAVAVHDENEYLSMLLNLYYSLRSEAYVCTLASNSCRLIDEMRATVGAKANRFYADLSIETCPHPPCLDMNEITFFGG